MKFTIVRAENLTACDINGGSDPFVKVIYDGKEIGATHHLRKTLNPNWRWTTGLTLSEESGIYYVVLEIWDRDDLSSNDFIGNCRIPFRNFIDNNIQSLWARVLNGGKESGTILVEAEFNEKEHAMLQRKSPIDVRDVYPPHVPRYTPFYCHIPVTWHPDPCVRENSKSRDYIIPQKELILHMVEEVTLTFHLNESNQGMLAAMVLTNYRLWFVPYKHIEEDIGEDIHCIPVGKIQKVTLSELKGSSSDIGLSALTVLNKDSTVYRILVSPIARLRRDAKEAEIKRKKELQNIVEEIIWLNSENQYCTEKPLVYWSDKLQKQGSKLDNSTPKSRVYSQIPISGCRNPIRYDQLKEFRRQGILDNPRWRITDANIEYELCPTYPHMLVVPSKISDSSLEEAASYRSKRRLPVLTWIHPRTQAPLCRSSQPRSGVLRANNSADIHLMWAIRDAAESKGATVNIVDARPEINAKSNALAGKGHESVKQYNRDGTSCATITFMGIDNIHVVRSSMSNLSEALNQSDDSNFLLSIQKSRWLEHIASILQGAVETVRLLERGDPVLVHCSDGWDRTSQLVSLTQVLLDPYYRTIEGFAILVEKDWCSFGHMFKKRCGYPQTDQSSPIFVQFLDAVYQLIFQFPTQFQFNEVFLNSICEGVYSSWYGTFQENCEKERQEFIRRSNPISLWDTIRANTDAYLNPLFKPPNNDEDGKIVTSPIYPMYRSRMMQLWSGQYEKPISRICTQHRDMELLALIRTQEDQLSKMSSLLTPDQVLELRAMQLRSDIHHLTRTMELDHIPDKPAIEATKSLKSPMQKLQTHRNRSRSSSGSQLRKNEILQKEVSELEGQLLSLQYRLRRKDSLANRNILTLRYVNYDLQQNEETVPEFDTTSFRVSAPIWERDRDAQCCKKCKKKFKAVYRGRHHCRSCGYVFCGRCTNYRMPLPEFGYYDEVRICSTCYNTVTLQGQGRDVE